MDLFPPTKSVVSPTYDILCEAIDSIENGTKCYTNGTYTLVITS